VESRKSGRIGSICRKDEKETKAIVGMFYAVGAGSMWRLLSYKRHDPISIINTTVFLCLTAFLLPHNYYNY